MTTKKQTKQVVTVEIVGTETQRETHGVTHWDVRCGANVARIVHPHSPPPSECFGWYWVERHGKESIHIFGRDFGAALSVARKMLGVRS